MTRRTLEIGFQSPLHHGSGFGLSGLVDRAVLRDSQGIPYLAGSAIKGRLRHAALRVSLAEGKPACEYGDRTNICMDGEPCGLCVLFGSVFRPGRLIFTNASLSDEAKLILEHLLKAGRGHSLPVDSSVRHGIARDRQLGTARKQLLFSTETLPDWLVFAGEVMGESGKHEDLLKKAALVLTHFGADAARGLGRCEWRLS